MIQSFPHSFWRNWFQQIIQGMNFEGVESITIISGHKNNSGQSVRCDCLEDLEAVHLGHLNVEQQQIDDATLDQSDCTSSVAAHTDNVNVGFVGQQELKPFSSQRLIVCNQGSYAHESLDSPLSLEMPKRL